MDNRTIEIPFGAKDSELYKFEYAIPEGYEARINGNKVIIEPKESNDEKIRKSLVEFFRKFTPEKVWDEMFSFGDVVSYLESQKDKREIDFAEGKVEGVKQTCQEIKDAMYLFEPKDLTPFEFTFRDYIDSAIRYCLSGEGYQQYIKEWAADLLNLEKQKEQKSLSISAASEWLREHVRSYINSEYNEFHKCVEYDGSIDKERLINDFEDAMQKEQKPAEWSAEDEKMLTSIIGRGSSQIPSHEPALREEQMEWLMKRLKSLRPQPHWKPSEEQMKALDHFIRSWGESGTMSPQNPTLCAAKSPLTDLQKLL